MRLWFYSSSSPKELLPPTASSICATVSLAQNWLSYNTFKKPNTRPIIDSPLISREQALKKILDNNSHSVFIAMLARQYMTGESTCCSDEQKEREGLVV